MADLMRSAEERMSEHFPWPKSYPGHSGARCARPLPRLKEERGEVQAFVDQNPQWMPMLSLYDRLCVEAGSELFGSAIMGGGLVLSVRPEVAHDEGVVVVYFDPRESRFSLSYRHRDVEPFKEEQCAKEEIWERLRLYLAYKFGVYRKQEPNQSALPTPV